VYAASPRFSPDFFDPDAGDLFSFGKTALSLRLLGKNDMMEVLRVTPMCVADWLNEWFENDLLKAGLAAPGLEGCFAGPWSSGTVTNLLWMESTVAQSIAGGPAALVEALEKAALANGVEIRCGAAVEAIDLETTYGVSSGHLFHGEHATDQLAVRPTPECAGYRTPFDGLFLCGSGSHPGGGITCAPGALAARTILGS